MKKKLFRSVLLVVLILLICATVAFAANCPRCGSGTTTVIRTSFTESQHLVNCNTCGTQFMEKHNMKASGDDIICTKCNWINKGPR